MSRSTTSTFSYTLIKYARSYPKVAVQSQSQSQSQSLGPSSGPEWQQFVTPIIKLSLDIRKSEHGVLESVKLRIVWDTAAGQDMMDLDQSEVVFENLELLSFSEMSTTGNPPRAPRDVPLKAFYRDSAVGIRYLHPDHLHPRHGTTTAMPLFRRFQVTFTDPRAANQFLDAIRPVCPCQPQSNGAPGLTRRASTFRTPGATGTQLNPLPNPSSISSGLTAPTTFTPLQEPSYALPSRRGQPCTSAMASARNPLLSSSPDLTIDSSDPVGLSGPSSSVLSFNSSSRPTSAVSEAPATCTGYGADRHLSDGNPVSASQQDYSHSLPSSSPPSHAFAYSQMPPPPAPTPASQVTPLPTPLQSSMEQPSSPANARSAFMKVLQEHHGLYEMSRAELEMLIGEVLREPGFHKLVETLDTMWSMKALTDR